MARLEELGRIVTGNTPTTSDENNYASKDLCFIKPGDIDERNITRIKSSSSYISEYARSKARILPPFSVLVTCIGIIGKVAINEVECAFNQQINAVIPNRSKCIPEYLAYALQNKQTTMRAMANAPVVPILNKTQFSSIEFHAPSLDLQKAVVDRLNLVCHLLSLRKQQLAKLDELVKARFVEMFGDPENNPMRWPIKKLNAAVSSITAGWSANGEARPKKAGEYAVLKVSAVTQGYFKPDEHKVIPADMEIRKYVYPQKGDLLFSRANTRELVGATAIINQDYPELLLPDKLWKVLFTSEMDVYYAKHILSTQAIRKVFSSQSTGTSGSMYNVSAVKFRDTLIPVPPIALQHEFAAFVKQADKSKLAIQQSIEKLETLKKSLMQQYFG